MRKKGKIRSWNEQKAFGFIRPSEGGNDVFLHISDMRNRNRVPAIGQIVTYTLSSDKQGRTCAAKALLPGERPPVQKGKPGVTGAIFVAVAFLCFVAFLVNAKNLSVWILWVYLIASLVTFLVYAFDKKAAKDGSWRTSESTLHWLALAGGWPGAFIAQQTLRHKSKKKSFRTVFWVTVIINCGALLWLCTPDGMQFVQRWVPNGFSNEPSATIEWAE